MATRRVSGKKRTTGTVKKISCNEVAVIDFETTGLSSSYDRVIEIGAVIVKGKKIVDSFSSLMNPGRKLPYFITELTGISNSMLHDMPKPEKIMPELKNFIGDRIVLAHNASFDSKFLHAEMKRAKVKFDNPVLCTMILSRRLIPNAYNHKLETLADHLNIRIGRAHRALDDAKATAKLWRHLHGIVQNATGIKELDNDIFSMISKKSKGTVPGYLEKIKVK